MRSFPLLASFLFSSALLAQAPPSPETPSFVPGQVIVLQPAGNKDCPVQLSAKHSRDTGMVKVSPRAEPQGQGYSVTFKPLNWRSVEQAKITLHGMSGAHVVPVKGHSDGDATESFTVSPSAEPNQLFQSIVYVRKLTGVQWIEINELTFADGTSWHESADSFCSVRPNGFMLVGAAK